MINQINTNVDIELEYKDTVLKFQMVHVTGTVASGPATYWEPSWSEVNLHIDMTPTEVQDWVVEMFEDDASLAPPWAYTDGQVILNEMKEHINLG